MQNASCDLGLLLVSDMVHGSSSQTEYFSEENPMMGMGMGRVNGARNARVAAGCLVLVGFLAGLPVAAQELSSPSPEGAELYFIEPVDAAVVGGTFIIKFGLRGMGVAPAGIEKDATGHHHLLIDHQGEIALNLPLPATDEVRHFGGGQTETTVTLPAGEHRLQLVLGNHLHVPHSPPVMSEEITITVMQ